MKFFKEIVCCLAIFLVCTMSYIVNPKSVNAAGPIIVLDPGHGGSDPGAVSGSYYEKHLNMNLAKKIAEHLKPISPTLYYTRVFDTYISLEDRANFANKMNADLFLSIHHDSNTSSSANGISTHYSSYRANLDTSDVYVEYDGRKYPYVDEVKSGSNTYFYYKSGSSTKSVNINNAMALDPTPSAAAKKSAELSVKIANAMASLGYNRMYTSTGARDHNLYVTRHTNMPSLLIENGFMSNPQELSKITNSFNIDRTARAIANEVIKMYGTVSTKANLNSVQTDKSSPQQENTSVTLTANATGNNVQYAFHVYNGKEWKEIQSYSSNNKLVWKPSEAGTYKVSVHAKNSNSTNKYDDYMTLNYVVYDEVNMTDAHAKQLSPQIVNTPIELEAKAIGGVNLEYKFHVYDGKEWTDLTEFTKNNTFTWIPTKAGDYKFSVHVKEATSTKAYDDYMAFDYKVVDGITINRFESNQQSPQNINSKITFSTIASGGTSKLYEYWLFNGVEWSVIREYSEDPEFIWTPTKNGQYKMVVHVKDKTSTNEYDAYQSMPFEVTVNNLSLHVDKVSPQRTGSKVILTANTPVSENLQYRFLVKSKTTGKETILADYSSNSTTEWIPSVGGDYELIVQAKVEGSSYEYDFAQTYPFTILADPIKVHSVSTNVLSPQEIGKTITLATNATGGIEKQYKYWISDGNEWKVLRDYSTSTTYNWTPAKAGKYRFSVHVKDVNSTKEYDAYKGFEYEIVVGPVKAKSLSVNKPSPQPEGTSLTLTANATGGTTKLYKFHLFDGSKWTVLRNYSTSNTVNWTPTKADEYKLVVHVKDQSSKKEYDSYTQTWYTINQSPVDIQGVNVSYESPQAVNVPIKLEAQASGGITKLYKFNVYDGKTWTDLTGYVTNPSYTWTPSKPGHYKFSVHVKDSRSKASYDDFYVFYYDVVNGVKITGITYPTEPQAVNQPVVVNATTTGGTKALYEYWVLENGVWKIAQAYSPESNLTWTPAKAGEYKFSLHVKDQHSSKEYDTYQAFHIRAQ